MSSICNKCRFLFRNGTLDKDGKYVPLELFCGKYYPPRIKRPIKNGITICTMATYSNKKRKCEYFEKGYNSLDYEKDKKRRR